MPDPPGLRVTAPPSSGCSRLSGHPSAGTWPSRQSAGRWHLGHFVVDCTYRYNISTYYVYIYIYTYMIIYVHVYVLIYIYIYSYLYKYMMDCKHQFLLLSSFSTCVSVDVAKQTVGMYVSTHQSLIKADSKPVSDKLTASWRSLLCLHKMNAHYLPMKSSPIARTRLPKNMCRTVHVCMYK